MTTFHLKLTKAEGCWKLKRSQLGERLKTTPLFIVIGVPTKHNWDAPNNVAFDHGYEYEDVSDEIKNWKFIDEAAKADRERR